MGTEKEVHDFVDNFKFRDVTTEIRHLSLEEAYTFFIDKLDEEAEITLNETVGIDNE